LNAWHWAIKAEKKLHEKGKTQRSAMSGITAKVIASLAACSDEASLRVVLMGWFDMLCAKHRSLVTEAEKVAKAARRTRENTLIRYGQYISNALLLRTLCVWSVLVKEGSSWRSRLAEQRTEVLDVAVDHGLRAASHMLRLGLFAVWAAIARGSMERREEEDKKGHTALLETQRQAAFARRTAEEAARMELRRQVADIQAEALLEGSELRIRELEHQVTSMSQTFREKQVSIAQYETRFKEMQDEMGDLTSQLLEERWALTGARARLQGYGLESETSLWHSGRAVETWKSEHRRSKAAIAKTNDPPAVLSDAIGSGDDECQCNFGLGCTERSNRSVRSR